MDSDFRHVLVATDGSPLADDAIRLALRVARGAPVTALLVVHDFGLTEYLRGVFGHSVDADDLRRDLLAEGRQRLTAAVARAAAAAPQLMQQVVLSDRAPHHEIVDIAHREGCDLIVMSSHGLGGRFAGLLGSQAAAVVALGKLPVLIAH